uniref:Serpentine receptor class gamma n=1 Tax=Caenorhabditis tropicalis TaxID=1561998 RepID=A0A1I7TRG5_9PELO
MLPTTYLPHPLSEPLVGCLNGVSVQNTTFPPEITCYSVIIAVLDNTVFHITIGTYVVQILISVTGSVGPLIYIGAIHGTLIIIPTIFQIYALFFELSSDNFAHVLLVAFAYHGFISTCAMMIFTKPLRDKLLGWLQWTNRTVQQIQPQSDMISSQAPI